MTGARIAAARVLLAVERGQTTLASEIDRARASLREADERDRALLVELAAGTLRWRGELDAVIVGHSRRAIDDLDPYVRVVLRTAAYQLLHLDRVPAHAVIHEAVEIVRALGQPRAAGLVNAVLRSIQRGDRRAYLPARPPADAASDVVVTYLTTSMSHPEWMARRWLDRYGPSAAERWCAFNNASPDLTVRSAGRMSPEDLLAALREADIAATPAPYVVGALRLPPGALGRVPRDLSAEVVVHDEGSQIVAHVVGARPGMTCLDLCAAPGGKTSVLSSDMAQRGVLIAADRRPARMRLLSRTLRSERTSAAPVLLDGTRPLPFGAVFDRVLVDAPCSGIGTLRRDPDAKWARTPDDLPRLADTQLRMLEQTADAVRPGGWLVYATCSSEPEENEDVVHAFLAARPDYQVQAASPGPHVHGADDLVDAQGFLRTLPFRDDLDAFFAAVLVRAGTP